MIRAEAGTISNNFVKGNLDNLVSSSQGRHMSLDALTQARDRCGQIGVTPDWAKDWAIDRAVRVAPHPERPFDDHDGHVAADAGVRQPVFDLVMPVWGAEAPSGFGLAIRLLPVAAAMWEVAPGYVPEIRGLVEVSAAQIGPPHAMAEVRPPPPRRPKPIPLTPADNPVPERWRGPLADIVDRIVAGDYAGLVADGLVPGQRAPERAHFEHRVKEYPGTPVPLPPEAWVVAEAMQASDGSWHVWVDLWTKEEGRSELALTAGVEDDGETVSIAIETVQGR